METDPAVRVLSAPSHTQIREVRIDDPAGPAPPCRCAPVATEQELSFYICFPLMSAVSRLFSRLKKKKKVPWAPPHLSDLQTCAHTRR